MYPASLRDTRMWASLWKGADPVRHWRWQRKNAGHRRRPPALSGRALELAAALRAHGVAVCPGFVPLDLVAALRHRAWAYVLAKAGVDLDAPPAERELHLDDLGNDLPPDDPVFSLLRAPEIARIVTAHLGFVPKLRRAAIFLHERLPDRAGPGSPKHFHIDDQDFRVLKLFIHLTDVTGRNGPFTYVRGTHFHGEHRAVVSRLPASISSREMERFVPRSAWVEAVGPRGTAVFAETSGVHRGGRVEEGQRVLLVAEYSGHDPWERFDHDIVDERLSSILETIEA
jgi:hypothetical protein